MSLDQQPDEIQDLVRTRYEARLKSLAKNIRNDNQLRMLLQTIEPAQRKVAYKFLKPHMGFKPLSWVLINKP